MGPNQGKASLALQFSLATGQSIRFVSPEITLLDPTTGRSATTVLGPFQVPAYGREGRPGAHESFPSSAVLKGIGRNSALATDTT